MPESTNYTAPQIQLLYKRCRPCGRDLSLNEFWKMSRGKDGLQAKCKDCLRKYISKREDHIKKYKQAYYLERREKTIQNTRKNNLLRRFGLTPEQYDSMLEEQGGVCEMCKEKCSFYKSLSVDHNHETGKVRGLLCRDCNISLGILKENKETLMNAIRYLERHENG